MNVRRTGLVVIVSGLLAAGCSQPGSPSASVAAPSASVAAPSASVVEPSASTASSGASTSPSSPSGSSGVSLDGSPFLGTYSTTIPARDRRVCLMQDPIYRHDVAHRSMGYPHVPQLSYYLGEK